MTFTSHGKHSDMDEINKQSGTETQANAEQKPDQKQSEPNAELKFTSGELKKRLDRAKAAAVSEILSTLGVASPEEAKTFIEGFKQAEESKKTDQEKLQAALDEQKKLNEKLAAERDEALTLAQTTARDASMRDALKAEGVIDADTALLIMQQGDTSEFVSDGKPDTAKIKAAVDTLKKDKAYLFGANTAGYKGGSSFKGGTNPNGTEDKAKTALAEMWKAQRRA